METSRLFVERIGKETLDFSLPAELQEKHLNRNKKVDTKLKRMLAFLIQLSSTKQGQENGYCFASHNDITKAVGISKANIGVCINMLMSLGLLKAYEPGQKRSAGQPAKASRFWLSDDIFPKSTSTNKTSTDKTSTSTDKTSTSTDKNSTDKTSTQVIDNELLAETSTSTSTSNSLIGTEQGENEKQYRNITKYNITKHNIIKNNIIEDNESEYNITESKEIKEKLIQLQSKLSVFMLEVGELKLTINNLQDVINNQQEEITKLKQQVNPEPKVEVHEVKSLFDEY